LLVDSHKVHFRSCARLSVGAWLLDVVPITMHIHWASPHPLTFSLSHCICGQPLDLMGSTFFVMPMVEKRLFPMMLCEMPLSLLWKMVDFMFYVSKPMFFGHLPFSFHISRLTLWFQWMVVRCWLTLSSLTP
jgi:hypothetical protein